VDVALTADLVRGFARQAPWLLMETSTSAVNWQPRNAARPPGQLRRHALSQVARGADGILYFQWRASRAGAEKFHAGLVPHAGTDTKVWREVTALGAELAGLAAVQGTPVEARAAVLWDYEAWWAVELDSHPSVDVLYLPAVRAYYDALWRAGITVDFVHPEADLSSYDLLLVPSLYLMTDAAAEGVSRRVAEGASLVVSYFSGIVDEHDHVRLGGYPGALREVLGVRVEEFFPLLEGQASRCPAAARARSGPSWWAPAGPRCCRPSWTGRCSAGRPSPARRTVPAAPGT
jgi:beta-galactosidase